MFPFHGYKAIYNLLTLKKGIRLNSRFLIMMYLYVIVITKSNVSLKYIERSKPITTLKQSTKKGN